MCVYVTKASFKYKFKHKFKEILINQFIVKLFFNLYSFYAVDLKCEL